MPDEPKTPDEILTPEQMVLKRFDERLKNLEDFIFSEKKGQEGLAVKLKVIDEWAGATQQKFKTVIDPLLERLNTTGGAGTAPAPSAVSTGDKEYDRLVNLMQLGNNLLNRPSGPGPLDKLKEDIFIKTLTNSMTLTDTLVQTAMQNLLGGQGKSVAKEMSGVLKG